MYTCTFFGQSDSPTETIKPLLTEEIVNLIESKSVTTFFVGNQGNFDNMVRRVLIDLSKKHKLFIVSNCLEGYIEIFLKKYNYNKYFIDFRNAANGKTKAENIIDIVKEHKLKTPVYVGDTPKDLESSLEAEVEFIHAAYGFQKVEWNRKISNLKDLLKL